MDKIFKQRWQRMERGLHGCSTPTLKIEDANENWVCILGHYISRNSWIYECDQYVYGHQATHLQPYVPDSQTWAIACIMTKMLLPMVNHCILNQSNGF